MESFSSLWQTMLQKCVNKILKNNEGIPNKGILSGQRPGLTTQGKYKNEKEMGKAN